MTKPSGLIWENIPALPVESDTWELIKQRLTPERWHRIERVARQRSEHVRLMIQDVHDPHNISACLRSADAFGLKSVDVITLYQKFQRSTASRGAGQWLSISRWRDVQSCVSHLREKNYRIAAGFPDCDAMTIDELPIDKPIAVLFGNEHKGVSADWLPHVDYRFTIPMFGMVESLNISVSAALTMHALTSRARQTIPASDYYLSQSCAERLACLWVLKRLKSPETELAKWRERQNP